MNHGKQQGAPTSHKKWQRVKKSLNQSQWNTKLKLKGTTMSYNELKGATNESHQAAMGHR